LVLGRILSVRFPEGIEKSTIIGISSENLLQSVASMSSTQAINLIASSKIAAKLKTVEQMKQPSIDKIQRPIQTQIIMN
jgi:hypothetical protein